MWIHTQPNSARKWLFPIKIGFNANGPYHISPPPPPL